MSQVSPPIRILLAASVLFMAVYFVALRPGAEEPAATPAPGAAAPQSAPGQTAKTATDAAAQASAAAQARSGQAPVTAPNTTSATDTVTGGQPAPVAEPSKKDVKNAGLPRSVAKAVASKKVVVLYFWNSKAADDRQVRREVRGVARHKGKVVVHVASIGDISRYAPITRGVDVQQSPTVVVVDRNLKGDKLEGFVDQQTIDQAVSDALRSSS